MLKGAGGCAESPTMICISMFSKSMLKLSSTTFINSSECSRACVIGLSILKGGVGKRGFVELSLRHEICYVKSTE